MNIPHKQTYFKPGDLVELLPPGSPYKKGITKRPRTVVHSRSPYRLLIISQIDPMYYSVAICKSKKKGTQICAKTNTGHVYIQLSEFLPIDYLAISQCQNEYLLGNRKALIRTIKKQRNAYFKTKDKEFFVDLTQSTFVYQPNEHSSTPQYKPVASISEDKQEPIFWDHIFQQLPVLDSGGTKCPYCKREFSGMSNIKYQIEGHPERFTSARTCYPCKLAILDQNQIQQVQHFIGNIQLPLLKPNAYKTSAELMLATKQEPIASKQKLLTNPLPFEKQIHTPTNLSEYGKAVLVYAQKCHCAKCFKKFGRHTIIPRTAKVLSVSGQLVDVTVLFCVGCGQYYMGYESFKQYKKVYGRLLFECVLSADLRHSGATFIDFAPDSILSRWGYSVKKDIPKEHRQAILRFLLDTKRVQKFEAIEMIKGFISFRESQPKFHDACERWREDILFINDYRRREQDVVYGLTFKQGGKITR